MNRFFSTSRWLLLWIGLALCWGGLEASACRYNVRDIGFVEVGGEGYTLYAYLDASMPPEAIRTMKEQGAELEVETNLRFVAVEVASEPDHPGLKYRPVSSVPGVSVGALVSPSGQVLHVPFPPFDSRFSAAWAELLKGLWSSPKREEIVRSVSQTFAAVLLVEGTRPEANRRARETILEAIAQIQGQMKSLPKAIAEPPVLLELPASGLTTEKILLWSLGLDSLPSDLPIAAVFYGKGRWIGNALRGEEISSANLLKVLSIIGADCECGIDISWTQGVRLPLRWRSDLQSQLAQSLGFDPENPLVRIEASRILNKRGTGQSPSQGYQEVTLEDESPAQIVGAQDGLSFGSAAGQPSAAVSGGVASVVDRATQRSESGAVLAQRSRAAVAALGLVVVCIGAGLFLRFRLKD
ncbi:MAG: hypothetical protein JNN07_24370 [Verrucomicrobiales bacterium]|nr:hypothetical protein [Verrucomicrobiales bacterium]